MPNASPNYSIVFSAQQSGAATSLTVGDCVVPDGTGKYVLSTTANRGTKRTDGIVLTSSSTASPSFVMQSHGKVSATVSGLAAGSASWVRVSSTGRLERVTPSGSDDVVGWAEADGSVHLFFGMVTAAMATGAGSSFTAGGDLSGSSSSQTVEKVKGTTITTAGGALAVGAVLRTTAVGTADWGQVNLADTDAVTGALPLANQAAPTGNGIAGITGGAWDSAAKTSLNVSTDIVLTDTGITQYDLMMANGTPKFVRFPKGSNSTVLQVNGAGVVAYATLVDAHINSAAAITVSKLNPGTNGHYMQTVAGVATFAALSVAASNISGGSNGTFLTWTSGAAAWGNTGTFFAAGTNPASTGDVRMPNAGTVMFRNAANSANYQALSVDAAGQMFMGDNQLGALYIRTGTGGTINTRVNTTDYLEVSSTDIKTSSPLAGSVNNTLPFRFKRSAITKSDATDLTLSGAQAECPVLDVSGTPGGNFNILGPNTTDARFEITNGTANTLTIKKSGGTGIAIATGKTATVRHNGTDYIRVTTDA